jgi:inhibitor of growth protein 3
LYEEANAKQESINECNVLIGSKDGQLQKWIKQSGSLTPHPKEEVFNKQILEAYTKAQRLQEEKIALIQKATSLVCIRTAVE